MLKSHHIKLTSEHWLQLKKQAEKLGVNRGHYIRTVLEHTALIPRSDEFLKSLYRK